MAGLACVTGANGFVGANLVCALVEDGWDVVALHRSGSDLRDLAAFDVRCTVADVTNVSSLTAAIPKGADVVFHAAGNTSLWARVHGEQMRVNVRGTRNVVRAALEREVGRLVHVSSIVAYGMHGGVITESTPTRGIASDINYVRSKSRSEREVRRGISRGLDAVIVNPSNIIGRYDRGNWSRLMALVRKHRVPAVPGGGGSFCHASEVARTLIAAARKGRCGANYLLGGADTTYLGLLHAITEVLGVRRRFVRLPPRVLRGYAGLEEVIAPLFGRQPEITRDAVALLSGNLYCSSRLAVEELGYQPRTLHSMLLDCRDWMLAEGLLKAR